MSDIPKRTKLNLFLIGDSSVGKTCLINCYLGNEFNESSFSTIGQAQFEKMVDIDNKKIKIKIYDTAGQERFRSVISQYYKVSDGFGIVFSVIKKESFNNVLNWIKNLNDQTDIKTKPIIIIGNKIDLPSREVTEDEAKIFAKEQNFKYFECSAKTGENVENTFNDLVTQMYEKYKDEFNDTVKTPVITPQIKPPKKKHFCFGGGRKNSS